MLRITYNSPNCQYIDVKVIDSKMVTCRQEMNKIKKYLKVQKLIAERIKANDHPFILDPLDDLFCVVI